MDSLDRLSHVCIWQAERHRIEHNKSPDIEPDPLYVVTLDDRKTAEIRYLFVNHKFPMRRYQGPGGCGSGSMIGYADTFRGEICRCNLPIERRWKVRSAQLLNKSIRGIDREYRK
jgi:hypothetical protein